jgi:hypothetical protein
MLIDIENAFNNVSQTVIFKKLWDAEGLLTSIIPFTKLLYSVQFFLYY